MLPQTALSVPFFRYLVGVWSVRLAWLNFPWGTLTVNVVGSFLIGLSVELVARQLNALMEIRLLLLTGVLGGFTTFSSFSLYTVSLFEHGVLDLSAVYVLASLDPKGASKKQACDRDRKTGSFMAGIEHIKVEADEAGIRLDRWFKIHYPGLGFGQLQKLLRSGQVRVDGGRMKTDARVQPGQMVRVPPIDCDLKTKSGLIGLKHFKHLEDVEFLARMLLHEDDKVFVFNKPAGVAVQGGSGVIRHIDGLLETWTNQKGEKPRLVHRLDRDTSGVLVVARTRGAAQKLTAAFREREAKKTYWALVKGVPRKHQDKISTWLVKEQTMNGDRMRIAKHGEEEADHAVSYYRVIDTAAQNLAWLEMEPYTGRTHQLRVHALHMGYPIIGDPKYYIDDPNWDFPGGIQKRLHLHACHIDIPHPSGDRLRVSAPLPPHMVQSWNMLGLDVADGDKEA